MSSNPIAAARRWLPSRLSFYYGWIMLPIAMIGVIATSPGQTFVVSVFNPSFREVLGLSHSQLTGAYMFGTFLAALPQPYFGTLMDRFGIRRMMTVVVLLFGAACLFASQTRSLVMLFLAFLSLRMFGQGALSLLSNNTLAMWFQNRLGTVSGIMNVGIAIAFGVLPAGVLVLIQTYGWRSAYAMLGLAVWLVMLPVLAFLFHNRPEDVGQTLDGAVLVVKSPLEGDEGSEDTDTPEFDLPGARRTRSYWIMMAASASWGMIGTGIYFNIIPLFAESGFSEAAAASTFAILSISMGITHVIGGYLADRVPLNLLAAVSLAFQTAGIWVLIRLESIGIWQLYPVLFGIGQGLIAIVGSTVWVRYFGRRHLGKIRGSIWTFTVIGTSLGPFIMGLTNDLFGSYQASLMIFAVTLLPITTAALWATPPAKPAG